MLSFQISNEADIPKRLGDKGKHRERNGDQRTSEIGCLEIRDTS